MSGSTQDINDSTPKSAPKVSAFFTLETFSSLFDLNILVLSLYLCQVGKAVAEAIKNGAPNVDLVSSSFYPFELARSHVGEES